MIKRNLLIAALAVFSFTAFAQTKIKDVRTNPDLFFLQDGEQPSSLDLLPPPPEIGSLQWFNDESRYYWGVKQRDTERGDQAAADANVEDVAQNFSEAFGTPITKENAPNIYKLVYKMREDAGDLATRSAKKYYNRIRPFKYYGVPTCNSKQEGELSTNGSYPSGHTTIGWAEALVLAEINPDRQNEILKRGFEMGQSRVICGYHWQSDVDAARIVASGVVARLHANTEFQKYLAAAKKEFAKLVKAGKVKKSEFVATPWDAKK